ncbi:hypothetical protein ADUPG1_012538 [Aduncisulcus paluster]|uniref:Uncharacterized protein n=1 Tax=Aduncisulcus paluster TaxID=2918883 RepID=A0ABQ5K401_9EUKA|nr:hypothetical protein ADUPG1_012538 [Aduncisulcus paluster]
MSSSTDVVIQTVKPEFVHKGSERSCPIPGDSPNIKNVEFPSIKAIDGRKKEGDEKTIYHISIPFSSSSPMKGAHICLSNRYYFHRPPSHLVFTLTSSKGDKTSKKYEFPKFKGYRWYFLPVYLPDVVLCEITGKGRKKEYFGIRSLVFIRDETPEEIKAREAREKLWAETPVVKPEFIREESIISDGRYSIPISRDDPRLVNPSFSMVKCKDDSYSKESEEYDQSLKAQKMLKGECDVRLSHLSIPFPSPSPMKGAYICVNKYSSPSLLFTFTDCDGKEIFKKYEYTRPKHDYEWHFLPIDLDNVVLCEIEGKGTWKEKNSRYFWINSFVFISREETIDEIILREAREKLWAHAPVVSAVFVKEGDYDSFGRDSIPIPRDDPKLVDPSFSIVKCKNDAFCKESKEYDKSSCAQKMLKGECDVRLSHLSIPFPSPSPMKGAYICVGKYSSPSLFFTFTDCDGKKTSKKYEFTRPEHYNEWHFLPIDLDNVVLCEIEGKGTWKEKNSRYFWINSFVFISREETIDEIILREAREKLWAHAPVVSAVFVKEGDYDSFGRDSIPIPRDDPKFVDPSFSMVKCKDDSFSRESKEYDQSSEAQRMLKGECSVYFSHLSIPFPPPSPMKGAYICVDENCSSPSLLFTFTDCDGKKTFKKYEFTRPEHIYEWHFLPIDLDNVVLCEIEGKGMWWQKNSRSFIINSLVFAMSEETIAAERLSLLPWKEFKKWYEILILCEESKKYLFLFPGLYSRLLEKIPMSWEMEVESNALCIQCIVLERDSLTDFENFDF